MSDGVGLSLDISNLLAAEMHISRLGLQQGDGAKLMEELAKLGEMQTRRRIETEKTAPDGALWPANIEGNSILLRTGMHLRNSVASSASEAEAEWGAAWEFAHVHQYGATITPKDGRLSRGQTWARHFGAHMNRGVLDAPALVFKLNGKTVFASKVTIPARPFVGISTANAEEITKHVSDFLGRLAA